MSDEYDLWAVKSNGTTILWDNFRMPEELLTVHRQKIDSGTYNLSWNKPKYYNAIDKILIKEDDVLLKTVTDMNDKVLPLVNIQAGETRYYEFKVFGKYPTHPNRTSIDIANQRVLYWFN